MLSPDPHSQAPLSSVFFALQKNNAGQWSLGTGAWKLEPGNEATSDYCCAPGHSRLMVPS